MTYDEYKKGNSLKKKNFISIILNKLFTITIFTMIVIIISNYNVSFRNFLINNVLNNTMDFSKVNNILDSFTNVFDTQNSSTVFSETNEFEEYLDGYKYFAYPSSSVFLKSSGIVTYIGNKDGYGNTIVVQQSDGYYAWYGNVNESIKLYDYVEKNEVIATTVDDFYYYVLYKDDIAIKNEN